MLKVKVAQASPKLKNVHESQLCPPVVDASASTSQPAPEADPKYPPIQKAAPQQRDVPNIDVFKM